MADIKFRALYPEGGKVEAGGLAILENGTLVRYHKVTGSSRAVGKADDLVLAINDVKIEDERREPKPRWDDKTV